MKVSHLHLSLVSTLVLLLLLAIALSATATTDEKKKLDGDDPSTTNASSVLDPESASKPVLLNSQNFRSETEFRVRKRLWVILFFTHNCS